MLDAAQCLASVDNSAASEMQRSGSGVVGEQVLKRKRKKNDAGNASLFLIWWPAATQPAEKHDYVREMFHNSMTKRNANQSRCSRAPQSFTHFTFYGVLSMSSDRRRQ